MQTKYYVNREPISTPKHLIPKSDDLPYLELGTAIIESAVRDYEEAVFFEDKRQMHILKRWFHSEWGQTLSMQNGGIIERRVKSEMEALKSYTQEYGVGRIVSVFEATPEKKELLKTAHIQFRIDEYGFFVFRNIVFFKAAVAVLNGKEE